MKYIVCLNKQKDINGTVGLHYIGHLFVGNQEIAKKVARAINQNKMYTAMYFLFGVIGNARGL